MTTAFAVRPAGQPAESPGQVLRFDPPPSQPSRAVDVAVRDSGPEAARRLWWRYAAQAGESVPQAEAPLS